MKLKRIIIILAAIGVGLILWGMLLPAETGPTLNKNARCKLVLMTRLQAEIKNYQYKFGSYPTGDYTQILKKLFGDDQKKMEFSALTLGERLLPSTFYQQIALSFLRLARIKNLVTRTTL